MLVFLAFVYLFVGISHSVFWLDQAVASSFALEQTPDSLNDGDSKGTLAFCDHCPTCIPAIVPAPAVVAVPPARLAQPVITVAPSVMAAPLRLDTPPPKFLT